MTMTAFKDGVGPNNIFADGSVVRLGLKERPGCEDGQRSWYQETDLAVLGL